jgi:hypothetical protein
MHPSVEQKQVFLPIHCRQKPSGRKLWDTTKQYSESHAVDVVPVF